MINIQNETRGAVPRYFALLGFVFLLLALSFGSLASNAAPQVLKRNAGKTPCRITSINAKTGVVTASIIDGGTTTVKASSGGQSFRFLVKDAALLSSLKEGQEIFADFNTQEVFTTSGQGGGKAVRLGGILTDSFGKSSAGPVDSAHPIGPVDGGRPIGPVDGAHPIGPVDGGRPIGPVDGARPAGPGSGKNPAGPIGGANLGNAANLALSLSQITSINPASRVVAAKVNSTGQPFRFFVKDAALLNSLKEGEQIFADFNTQEVFASAGASGRGVRLGSILTDNYTKIGGGPAGGTNPPQRIGVTNPAGPGATGGQPRTESAPVAPGAPVAGPKQAGPRINRPTPPQIQNFAVFPGPIPGGQDDIGRVDLSAVPADAATIQISSDQPAVASVAAPVQISNSTTAVVVVKTHPVTKSTDVTLSAQVVGSSQVSTTKLTVRPPAPVTLECSPSTLIGGTPIACKVWLDGPAPGSAALAAKAGAATPNLAAQIQISTNNSQVASVPGGAIPVPAGATSAEFQVPTTAYPEPVDVVISASNQGSTPKSATVKLTAAAIRSFGCGFDGNSSCETIPGYQNDNRFWMLMTFSGPTPAGFITVSSNSGAVYICNSQSYCYPSLAVPQQAGAKSEVLSLLTNAVAVSTTATLSAKDPLSGLVKSAELKIDAPTPAGVRFLSQSGVLTSINNVLAGGQQVVTVLQLNGDEPDNGITFDVKYSASDAAGNPLQGAVTGPAQFTYGPLPQFASACTAVALTACFYTTVQPCEVNAPCKLTVTIGQATGTIYVNP